MRFSITRSTENNLDAIVLKDEEAQTSVAILPEHGALLHAFRIVANGDFTNVIDNYTSQAQLQRELGTSYKSAKLSPFPCRIPDGKYVYNGNEYQFQHRFSDGSAIHGLLYDKPFAITSEFADADNASVSMVHEYNKTDAGYPFHYRCAVQYALRPDNLLEIRTTVSNIGESIMPVADGWHPYFQLGGKSDEWLLHFHAASILEFDNKLVPTGTLFPYESFNNPRKLGNLELDNCFLLKKSYSGAACTLTNSAKNISLSLYPDNTYPYLQIYTPPQRNSIAIENLSAAPDCFNNKMGLLLLSPGDSQTFTVSYQLSAL